MKQTHFTPAIELISLGKIYFGIRTYKPVSICKEILERNKNSWLTVLLFKSNFGLIYIKYEIIHLSKYMMAIFVYFVAFFFNLFICLFIFCFSQERLEVDPSKASIPDICNIVSDKSKYVAPQPHRNKKIVKERANSADFEDDPDVPPLMWSYTCNNVNME